MRFVISLAMRNLAYKRDPRKNKTSTERVQAWGRGTRITERSRRMESDAVQLWLV